MGQQVLDYRSSRPLAADEGVYYAGGDCPGMVLRLLVSLVDVIVAVGLSWLVVEAARALLAGGSGSADVLAGAVAAVWWLYLVVLKRSRLGTLGYWIFRVKVVNLKGEPPGLGRMTLRMVLALAFNPLLDLAFVSSDETGQALRDRLSGTRVVRRGAEPVDCGRLVHTRMFFMGAALVYRTVSRETAAERAGRGEVGERADA
jgi:uncharacterized RDD family membrane protein YckC